MPLQGKGPEDLRVAELLERVAGGEVKELIIATSPDVEGEATAHFIAAEVEHLPVTVTRSAAGVPVGADLSYADAATMAMAIGGRRALK
jgi:recombination protein RecR